MSHTPSERSDCNRRGRGAKIHNVFSFDITEKVKKLAKKIKGEANGHQGFALRFARHRRSLTPAPVPAQRVRGGLEKSALSTNQRGLSTVPTSDTTDHDDSLSPQQKQALKQANFAKAKSDTSELAVLARELREELNKPNVDVLSREVLNRAQRIGKLAKKLREETKPY